MKRAAARRRMRAKQKQKKTLSNDLNNNLKQRLSRSPSLQTCQREATSAHTRADRLLTQKLALQSGPSMISAHPRAPYSRRWATSERGQAARTRLADSAPAGARARLSSRSRASGRANKSQSATVTVRQRRKTRAHSHAKRLEAQQT